MCSSTLSLTSTLDGVDAKRHSPAALSPGKTRWTLYRRPSGTQGRSGRVRKISLAPGFDPRTVQSVASRYTGCDIPAPKYMYSITWKLRATKNVLYFKELNRIFDLPVSVWAGPVCHLLFALSLFLPTSKNFALSILPLRLHCCANWWT